MKSRTVQLPCLHCGHVASVTVYPPDPGKIHGPPERCYPPEPAYIEPDTCDHCEHPLPESEALELASDQVIDDRASEADATEAARYERHYDG